jgi:hypothetical protein
MLLVPGSRKVKRDAEPEGSARYFAEQKELIAAFENRTSIRTT